MKMKSNLLISTLLLAVTSAVIADDPLFDAPWRAFDVADFPGYAPLTMVAGDMDGDGDEDVIVSRQQSFQPGISVLLNDGEGAFAAEVLYDLGINMTVEEAALNDFDSDGDLDVIATVPGLSSADFRFAVWRNNGDGTLADHELFLIGRGPWGLAVADFNGDGFEDVATADDGYWNNTNHSVSVIFHNGQTGIDAGFEESWTQYDLGSNGREIYAADLEGDGDLDLIVSLVNINGSNGVSIAVLLNDGSGTFTSGPAYINQGWDFAVADVNGDKAPDLVLAGSPTGIDGISIRLNDGNGLFGSVQAVGFPQFTPRARSVATADLNDDGFVDILATTPDGRAGEGWISIINNGNGQFSFGQKYESSKWSMDILGNDIDSDGDQDVLTIAQDASVLTVHKNPGNGAFPILPRLLLNGQSEGTSVGQINGDGSLDIAYWYQRDIQTLTNDGSGQFANGAAIDLGLESPEDVELIDMTGNGVADLAVATGNAFRLYPNNGDGTFSAPIILAVNQCGVDDMASGDIDNDGDIDIAIADRFNCAGGYRISIIRNDGNGVLAMGPIANSPEPTQGIRLADVNNDGNLDLVTLQSFSGIGVFLGNGDLTFDNGPILTGEFPRYWDLGDADGDGNLDVLMVLPQDSFGTVFVGVSLGYGDGGFQFRTEYPGPNGREGAFLITSACRVADVNSDGRDDLITTNNAPNDISVFLAGPDGTLLAQDRYGTGYSPGNPAIGDFNNDGRIDIAPIISLPPSGFQESLVVLLNHVVKELLPGDINLDGEVGLLDVAPFVGLITTGTYQEEGDMDGDGAVTLLDVAAFVDLLSGG